MFKFVIIVTLVCICTTSGLKLLPTLLPPYQCDENVNGPIGSIHSPGYPLLYYNNLNCHFTITTSPGTAVTLKIENFDVENYYDNVMIYNGPTTSSELIGTYTGYNVAGTVLYATENSVLINFITDGTVTYKGFNISFQERVKCDEQVQGTYGTIASLGFPTRNYPNNRDCIYRITTSPGTMVTYDIVFFSVELDKDYLEFFDGPTTGSPLLHTYTGTLSRTIAHGSTNNITGHFHSDSSGEYPGFFITTRERDVTNCPAAYYTGNSGSVSSPNYPSAYQIDSDCFYLITTPTYTQVIINFQYLDIETTSHCDNDYVAVYDGPLLTDPRLARVCGTGPVPPIFSTSNVALVHFHSNSDTATHYGFNVNYNTNACPAPIYYDGSVSGTISSPGYPKYNYTNNLNCVYYISAPVGSQLIFHVNYLQMEWGSDNCPYDRLKIFDGFQPDSLLLANLCGIKFNSDFHPTSNQARVEFITDSSVTDAGFSITYTVDYNKVDEVYPP